MSSITTMGGGGRCLLLGGRGGEVGNDDDCDLVDAGDGWVELGEFLDRAERVAESLREGNAFTASSVEKDGMVGDSGRSDSETLPPREFGLTAGRRGGGSGSEGSSTEGDRTIDQSSSIR